MEQLAQTEDAVESGQESDGSEGQSAEAESQIAKGQSDEGKASASGDPDKGVEGLPAGITPGDFDGLLKTYKSLQTEFGKRSETMKQTDERFAKYGGMDQITQWAEYLSNNPRFSEWVMQEHQKSLTGQQEPEMDESTKRAVDIIQKIADSRISEAMKQKVEPLADRYKQQMIDESFKKMSEKYGAEWNEMRNDMQKMAETLPESVQDNPSFEDLEDLYFKSLRKTGKLESFAAKIYEKSLTAKKAQSTEKGNSPKETVPTSFSTIKEAFEAAKKMRA